MALELARLELATLMRPLLWRLPRGYGTAYRVVLGEVGSTYKGDPLFKEKLDGRRHRVFFDRHLGCHVLADVGDAASRNHFVLGRYYESFVPLLIERLLGPRDEFIDIGANRGVHTMFAARHLAGGGRVVSFEPHPRTFRVLSAHVTINDLRNVELHNMGLSDEAGTLPLQLFADDAPSGCSFIDKGENPVQEVVEVPIQRLVDVIGDGGGRRRTLIKVDTEGFEHRAIRGMGAILDRPDVAISAEIMDDWLRRAGSSARELFEDLTSRGFLAYMPDIQFRGLRETLRLDPIRSIPDRADQYDLVFAKPGMVDG